jgi:hypothetical protein
VRKERVIACLPAGEIDRLKCPGNDRIIITISPGNKHVVRQALPIAGTTREVTPSLIDSEDLGSQMAAVGIKENGEESGWRVLDLLR